MSGFEIAGVVLGSIPIVISALEFYMRGISTVGRWRRFEREIETLVLQLSTEEANLQNVYERLLCNIVPDENIEPMLQDPFGPLWRDQEILGRINRRLWRHRNIFEQNVRIMDDAMEEAKRKLNIGPDGNVRWIEASTMKKQFKRTMFILQQDEYQNLLKTLRKGVSNLERLLSGNAELEPSRRRRSQAKWYRLLRGLSASVYEALRSAITCECPGLHHLGLQLVSRPASPTPNDDDGSQAVKDQQFHVAFSTASAMLASENNLWETSNIWHMLSLSLVRYTSHVSHVLRPSFPESRYSDTTNSGASLGAVVSLGMLTPPPESDASNPNTTISSLCQAIRKSRKRGLGECGGQVVDTSSPDGLKVFWVNPLGSSDDRGESDWSPVSLGSVLSRERASTVMHAELLHLAWIIASSVMQLLGTPWLREIPSHDNIFVAKKYGKVCVHNAFIMKRLPEPRRLPPPLPTNSIEIIKALGFLLIELAFGQTLDCLRANVGRPPRSIFVPAQQNVPERLSDEETTSRLIDQVQMRAGTNYHSAVKLCVNYNGVVGTSGQDILAGVLEFLGRDLKYSDVMW